MKNSKYKISTDLYKCECGREFQKAQSLNAHFCFCLVHKIAIGKSAKIAETKIRSGSKCSFSKDFMNNEQYCLMHKTAGKTLKRKIQNG